MKALVMDDAPVALDLVAHFLGIATHDNVNAAPSPQPRGWRWTQGTDRLRSADGHADRIG